VPDVATTAVTAAGTAPIFLAGADRSGIGLLGELLERHPQLAMTRRVDFWTRWAGRFGDLRRPENVDRCLAAMTGDRRARLFTPDRTVVADDLATVPTYEQLYASLQRQRMEQLGRTRWGDKSLGAERHAEHILRRFPTARFVHVLRDPRDRYASQKHHRTPGRGGVAAGAAMWAQSARLADRHARVHPDRYHVVRYEDLVRSPERTVRQVCAFLDLPFDARLLPDASEVGTPPGPLHTGSIGRYRQLLPPHEIALLELGNRRRMRHHGYAPDPIRLTGAERLPLASLPSHLGRAALWASWTWFGARVRRPSPRT
jgi:hypothetical protein